MNRDTVRSVGIFSAVIVVLAGLALGGVYFAKTRHQGYAPQAQEVAQNEPEQQPAPTTENQDQGSEQNTPAEEPAPSEPQTTPPNEGEEAPAETPQPDATQNQESETPAPTSTTDNTVASQVPQTGAEDIILTVPIVMLVVYLAVSVKRSKATLERRLLS